MKRKKEKKEGIRSNRRIVINEDTFGKRFPLKTSINVIKHFLEERKKKKIIKTKIKENAFGIPFSRGSVSVSPSLPPPHNNGNKNHRKKKKKKWKKEKKKKKKERKKKKTY